MMIRMKRIKIAKLFNGNLTSFIKIHRLNKMEIISKEQAELEEKNKTLDDKIDYYKLIDWTKFERIKTKLTNFSLYQTDYYSEPLASGNLMRMYIDQTFAANETRFINDYRG